MHFKLIVTLVKDEYTDAVMDAARERGATGVTIITTAKGEGLNSKKTFFGLNLETQCDVVLFLVEEHISREILETIAKVGDFEGKSGAGIAFKIDVEDAVGVSHQIEQLQTIVDGEI